MTPDIHTEKIIHSSQMLWVIVLMEDALEKHIERLNKSPEEAKRDKTIAERHEMIKVLQNARNWLIRLCEDYSALDKRNLDLERVNLQLIAELKDFKSTIEAYESTSE